MTRTHFETSYIGTIETIQWAISDATNNKTGFYMHDKNCIVSIWNTNKILEREMTLINNKLIDLVNWIKELNYCWRLWERTSSNYCSRLWERTSSHRCDFSLRLKVSVLLLVLISVAIEFQVLAALYLKAVGIVLMSHGEFASP